MFDQYLTHGELVVVVLVNVQPHHKVSLAIHPHQRRDQLLLRRRGAEHIGNQRALACVC